MEAYKGFEPGKVDIVFVSSDRSKELQQRYMETGIREHNYNSTGKEETLTYGTS